MPSKIVSLSLRAAEAVFGAVVLGLAITLIKGQGIGKSPAATNYAAFVGGFTIVGALVGVAAVWVEVLQSVLGIAIDALVLLFNLAGGVAIAVIIGGINCSSGSDYQHERMFNNTLINGGCKTVKNTLGGPDYVGCTYAGIPTGKYLDGVPETDGWDSHLGSRCKENQAEAAFMLINVILLLATMTMAWLFIKKYR